MNKYYAYEGGVGILRRDNSIEISNEQYKNGLEAIQSGKWISIKDGFKIVNQPDMKEYIVDGKLIKTINPPHGAELYKADEWYIDKSENYLKKDDEYELSMKKESIRIQLSELDSSVSARILREATLGDKEAIAKIKNTEEKAKELREKLKELEN